MKKFYYYCRDWKKRPMVTTCIVADDQGTYARGTALCSVRDNPCKAKGRRIAYGRAMKAYHCQEDVFDDQRRFWKQEFLPAHLEPIEYKLLGLPMPQ